MSHTETAAREYPFILEKLLDLCRIPSPSGFTKEAAAYVHGALAQLGFSPEYTAKGSVRCRLGGSGAPLVLSAHVDTLGAMVRAIKPNGRLRIAKVGGYPENYIENENCLVHTRSGRTVTGRFLIDKPAVHVNKEAGTYKRDDSTMEIVLDEKAATAEAVRELGIRAGDFVSFDARPVATPSGFIKSRHLDDKASSAVLIGLARWIAAENVALAREVWLLFTTYEEVGHGGAAGLPPDTHTMLSVDMGAVGDDLRTNEHTVSICAKDSNGPYDYDLTGKLIELAERHGIAHEVDVYPFYGSDADAALGAGWDIRHGLVGPGVQASHGYERTHREGIEATFALLAAFVTEKP